MSSPPADYRSMSVAEMLGSLALRIYTPHLVELRGDLRPIPAVLRIPILIIDLDTEVMINGMLGFLENSTGLYLAETIEALGTISAHNAASTLRIIQQIMADHGVTVERLRRDFDGAQLYEITSFLEMHGDELSPMAEQIELQARKLNLYDPAEPVFDLLEAYLQGRRDEFMAALEAYVGPG
jgi:hypothetical protein